MNEFLDMIQSTWAVRALLASSMVGLMCGVLGCFIVLRNMALIGDALSHAVLPGVVVAFMLVGLSTIGFFVGAVTAGLFSAVVITWIQQRIKTKNDAAIGIVFTAMFSLGVMGISWISHGQGVHLDLKDFLFGNILGVSNDDLGLTALVLVAVVASIIIFYRYLFVATFQSVVAQTMGISVTAIHYLLMLLLSFAVVAALRTVGVILVVAMLITPASTALLLSERLQRVLIWSAVLGLISAVIGLMFAIQVETAPGPAMTVVSTLFYGLAVLFAPKKGIIRSYFRKRALTQRIELEDVLRQLIKLKENNNMNFISLKNEIYLSENQLKKHLNFLTAKKLLTWDKKNNQFSLTTEGGERANILLRAHRLWETYLATEIGIGQAHVHDEADQYEHHLTTDVLDEVDKQLGFPSTDPHGSPIPPKS